MFGAKYQRLFTWGNNLPDLFSQGCANFCFRNVFILFLAGKFVNDARGGGHAQISTDQQFFQFLQSGGIQLFLGKDIGYAAGDLVGRFF